MLRDLIHSVKASRGISPVSGGANDTASVSQIIDMQGYAGCLVTILLGAIADADATFTVLVEESIASFTGVAVPDNAMISQTAGTAPEAAASFVFDSDDTVKMLDYVPSSGTYRYLRVTITPANNTGAWLHGLVFHQYGARHNPAGVTMAP
jgi:hypothetical protein